jgi:flagellar hook-associated protein 2
MATIQFSGLASGIDSSALIEATLAQQRATRIEPLETKISALEDTNSALEELSSLLKNLRSSAEGFRTLAGGGVSKQAISSDESIITAISNTSATPGSQQLTVTQLASAGKLSFDDRFLSSSSAVYSGMNDGAAAADRTVTFTIGTGSSQETVAIELTSSSSLSDIAQAFNQQSNSASASVVNVGTSSAPSYALVINSDDTGTEAGEIGVSVGSAVTDGGAGAFNSFTLKQAQNAEFTLDGVSGVISRPSNTVSDLIDGTTFTLQSTGTATINTGVDADGTANAVKEFIEAFNEVVKFIKENDTITSQEGDNGTENIFGSLAQTRIDDNALTSLRSTLSASKVSGTTVNILADLGITTNRDGTLDFDEERLKEALADEPTKVSDLLANMADRLATTGGVIDQFTRYNGLIDATINSQRDLITDYQKKISETEGRLSARESQLTSQFARLESLIGNLQSQQNSLSSLLGGG